MNFYNRKEYDLNEPDMVSALDELSLWSAPFGLKLLDTIKLKQNMTVMDIGFGLGFPAIEIAARLGKSGHVYGIDPWKLAITRAEQKISALGLTNITLYEGCAEKIPMTDNCISLIVSNNGINNVQNLEQVFSECRRIAEAGAQFTATVNLDGTMHEFYEIFESASFI